MTEIQTSKISFLFDSLNDKDAKLAKTLDDVLSTTFGILLTFLGDDLSPQQRMIWLAASQVFPKASTGINLAKRTGSSTVSKAVYKSINILNAKGLIRVDQPHPRVLSVQANPDHPMPKVLIDLCNYYLPGDKENQLSLFE